MGASPEASRHFAAWPWLAYHGQRGCDHLAESLFEILHLVGGIQAEKPRRRKIECQLLRRRVKQHRSWLAAPARDLRRDAGVERGQVGFHGLGLECDGQRTPRQAALVK